MNIPRQFYGVNYLSKLIANYQDTDPAHFERIDYNVLEKPERVPLEHINTKQAGLNAALICSFIRKLCEDRSCGLEGIAVAKDENLILNLYRPPYSADTPHITNSTCKTVTAIAVMFALSEDRLKLEDKVLSFFPEHDGMSVPKSVRNITVEHLLTMTSASKTNEIISVCEDDWVKAFLLTDCMADPGTKFVYNSMNTYMLGAIVHKVTGESLMNYLTPRFFTPLGISHIKWELCPNGLERAGWGLHICLEDMCKIGIFLASDGSFGGSQLIHSSYIRRMKEINVTQDADGLSTGYGYQLWHLPKGFYMLSGMYGQHVIIDEKNRLVVATNSHSDKLFPDSKLTRTVLSFMNKDELYQSDSSVKEMRCYHRLNKMVADYSKDSVSLSDRQNIEKYLAVIDRKHLVLEKGSFKLFPYLMQSMYRYPPYHVNELAVRLTGDTVKVAFYKVKYECLVFEAGIGTYHLEYMRFGEDVRPVACRVYMARDEDEHNVLMLNIVFPDAGYTRVIKLFFLEDDRYAVECMEYPDVSAVVDQVLHGETVLGGNVIDLADKLPESMRVMINHTIEPRVSVNISGDSY